MTKSINITRAECSAINQKVMEKLDILTEQLNKLAVSVASIPDQILQRTDARYASKNTEQEVDALKNKIEARNYEWLKYLATLIIGSVITYLLFAKNG